MINATVFFVFFIVIFGFIGTTRGWVREVIVTFAMMFALFIYQIPQFNQIMNPLINQNDPLWRFFWRSAPFLIITFFGYLSPVVAKGRFERNAGNRFEYGLLSFLIGVFNGYVLFSSLAFWALNAGLLDGAYASLFQPPPGGWAEFFFIKSAAPVIFSGGLLIFIVIIIFLFVIIVLI